MLKADLILLNGKIATMNEKNPWAEALVFSGDRIIFVGKNKMVKDYVTKETEVIDLKGRLVLPGFNDAHLHFLGGGLNFLRVDLRDCRNFEEIGERIKEKANKLKPGSWILGRGWDHTLFNQGKWPDKTFLDKITPQNPVYLKRIDGHVGWANSLALQMSKIDKNSSSPEGGTIIKDAHTGEPIGILLENAMQLVERIIPKPSFKEQTLAIREAVKEANRFGITSVQDNSDVEVLEVYKKLLEKDELKVRVSEWLPLELIRNHEELKRLIESFPEKSNLLKPGLLKIMADGTLGSRTAFLFEPYSDELGKSGVLLHEEKELEDMVMLADKSGYQVGIHAIGDRANHTVLNVFEKIQKLTPEEKRRHRIEHCSVLREADIPRFAKSGTVASVQPSFWSSDKKWLEQRLGKERMKGAYAFKSLLDSGTVLAFGTDWPVESLNPMLGIYSAVTRNVEAIKSLRPVGTHGHASLQKLTVEQAVKAYILGSAYAEFQEKEKGSLEIGKLADMVVLSNDIFSIQPEEIKDTQVEMTILGGKVIYSKQ
ncbi:MAG: amidohydrolase [candidate division Zixibacteria bacterium]|nr:amidohydrolase [candidate division Zixibacteria bacterium]